MSETMGVRTGSPIGGDASCSPRVKGDLSAHSLDLCPTKLVKRADFRCRERGLGGRAISRRELRPCGREPP